MWARLINEGHLWIKNIFRIIDWLNFDFIVCSKKCSISTLKLPTLLFLVYQVSLELIETFFVIKTHTRCICKSAVPFLCTTVGLTVYCRFRLLAKLPPTRLSANTYSNVTASLSPHSNSFNLPNKHHLSTRIK